MLSLDKQESIRTKLVKPSKLVTFQRFNRSYHSPFVKRCQEENQTGKGFLPIAQFQPVFFDAFAKRESCPMPRAPP